MDAKQVEPEQEVGSGNTLDSMVYSKNESVQLQIVTGGFEVI